MLLASTGGRSSILIIILVFGALFFMLYFTMPAGLMPAVVDVKILDGSALETSERYLEPEVIWVKIGVNNTVRWINEDAVPHTITSDDGYRDPSTGRLFDVRAREQEENDDGSISPFIMPGETFDFTFTEAGVYGYHGEPHPWIKGTIIVAEP
jgi:plastocyanin